MQGTLTDENETQNHDECVTSRFPLRQVRQPVRETHPILLGLHRGLQARGDKAARLRRQGVLRANEPESAVDLSSHSSAVSQTTERAEMLRGGTFVAPLEITEREVELGSRPLRVLAHCLAEGRH